jgi:predicted esterase
VGLLAIIALVVASTVIVAAWAISTDRRRDEVARDFAKQVFLAHGTSDDVLPIEQCGRALARAIGEAGYELEYIEFEGKHVVVDQIAREAFTQWFNS